MKKFSKIKRVGHDQNKGMFENPEDQLLIKEKLDGANFRFTVNEDDQLVFGSKNLEYIDEDGNPAYSSEDYEKFDGRFKNAVEFIKERFEKVADTGISYQRYTFFGENMVSHSLEYDWENTPQVIGFDVYDHEEERWLDTNESQAIFKDLMIPYAPITGVMTVKKFKELKEDDSKDNVPESEFRDGKAEGIVIINQDAEENDGSGFNTRAKLVTEEFKEKHKEATGARQSVEAVEDHERLVSKYCTDARIEKQIHKMRDEGHDLGMRMMSPGDKDGLFVRVSKDIIQEEYADIATSNYRIDFEEFRNLVAKRCAHTLKQEVQKL